MELHTFLIRERIAEVFRYDGYLTISLGRKTWNDIPNIYIRPALYNYFFVILR